MKVADLRQLGFLPLQDHGTDHPLADQRGVPDVDLRNVPGAARFMGWDPLGRPQLELQGDVVGAVVARYKENQREFTNAWAFAMPSSWTGRVPQGTTTLSAKLTTPIFERVAPTGEELPADPRLEPIEAYPAGYLAGDRVPVGHVGTVVGAIREDREEPVFFSGDRRLATVNKLGNPSCSNHVYDLDKDDRHDDSRRAPLHSHLRVVRTQGNFPGKEQALAWNLSGGGQDGCIGGLVHDLAAGQAMVSASEQLTVPPPVKKPDRVETQADFNPYVKNNNSTPADLTSQTRPPTEEVSSEPRNPPQDGMPVVLQPDVLSVVAHSSYRFGGPFSPGPKICQHDMGVTLDGEPQRPVHLDTASLFAITEDPINRDGPLPFSGDPWASPPRYDHPNFSEIVWDPKAPHTWRDGKTLRGATGRWKIQGTVPFFQMDGQPPPPPPPKEPPPPLPPPLPPPGGTRFPPLGGDEGWPGGSPGTRYPGGVRGGSPPQPEWIGVPYGFAGPDGRVNGYTVYPAPTQGQKPKPPEAPPENPMAFLIDQGFGNVALTGFDPVSEPPTLVTPGPRPVTVFPQPIAGSEIGFIASPTGDDDADPARGYHDPGESASQPTGGKFIGLGTSTPSGQPVTRGTGECGSPLSAVEAVAIVPGCTKPNEVNAADGEVTLLAPPGQAIGVGEWDSAVGVVDGVVTQVDDGGNMEFVIKGPDGTVDTSHSLTYGPDGLIYDGQEVGTGGGSAGALPGGTGADGDYDPADGASLATGLPNYDNFTLQAGRTINGNAGQFHYVQVAGDAVLNGTINLDGRGNEGGNGGAGGASSAAGNGTNGTAGSAGTGTKAATAGGGARGGGSGSGDGGTRSGGNGGTGGAGGNRGAPWSGDGQGTGGAGTAGGTGAGSAGTLGGNAAAVDPSLLARRVSHDFLVALFGGAGGGGGGGGGGYAAGTVVAAGGAGASTYADADGTGADGADGTFSVDSSGGGGGGKGGRGGGVYIKVVRGNVSGTFTINARGAQGGNGGVGNATGGDGGAGGGGGGGFVLIVFFGTWSATMTCNVAGGDSPAGQGAGEDGFYAVVNGSTGEVVQWGGSLASIAERTSALVAVQPTISAAPADPLVSTAPTTIVPVDTTGGAFAVELPPADSVEVGDTMIFKDAGGGATAEPLTIDANAADTIDGGASTSLGIDSGSLTLQKITANTWMIV